MSPEQDSALLEMNRRLGQWRGWLVQRLDSEDAADDVIQSSLLAAAEALARGIEIRDPAAYVRAILRRKMAAAYQAGLHEAGAAGNVLEMPSPEPDPEQAAIEAQRHKIIRMAIADDRMGPYRGIVERVLDGAKPPGHRHALKKSRGLARVVQIGRRLVEPPEKKAA